MTPTSDDFGFLALDEGPSDDFGFVEATEESEKPQPLRAAGRLGLSALIGAARGASQLGGQPDLRRPQERGEFFSPETGLEKGVARGAEAALTTAALGGGGKVAGLAASGGLLGQAVEEAGGGPAAQFVAEILPVALSPVVAGKLVPSKANRPFVKAAKRLGMTDKEIAPLVRGGKANSLAKSFIAKPSTRKKIVAQSEKGVQKALRSADEAVAKIGPLPQDLRTDILESFGELSGKVEGGIGELAGDKAAANFLRQEMRQIAPKELTGNDLRKLYRAINDKDALRSSEVGRLAKEKIVEVMTKANPTAAKDFETANQLYRRLKIIEGGPRHAGERLDRMELYGLVTGIATGHTGGAIKSYAGAEGLRSAFTKAVSGPRGHRLVQKMFSALAEGKPAVAQAAAKRLLQDTEEDLSEEPGIPVKSNRVAGLGLGQLLK